MTNPEVYLRARLADEEKRLEAGMKAAIEWALAEIDQWKGMWEIANKRAAEHRNAVTEMRKALESFAMIGNPLGYHKRPNRLDVPFEWCEAAYRALEAGKEDHDGK